jgi:hypothetical protein
MDILFLSGGEPYSHPRALDHALKAARSAGKYSMICTSVYWARDARAAERMLDRHPLPDCLWISTDVYHEEFVPLSRIRIAAEAARARGLDVVVQMVESAQDHDRFMERYEREVGYDIIPESQICLAPFSSVGRAVTEVASDEPAEPVVQPSAPCVWLGTPWLREDGALCACPNLEVFATPGHPLRIGDLNREGFRHASERADRDPYLQALRVFGPLGLTEQFPAAEWGWTPEAAGGPGPCDTCHSITRTPGLVDRIRAAAGEQETAERIAALRLAYYGEMSPPRG